MRLRQIVPIVASNKFGQNPNRVRVEQDLRDAVAAIVWPVDTSTSRFTIRPDRHGNGVLPIKNGFVEVLTRKGWRPQERYPRDPNGGSAEVLPGAFDAWLDLEDGTAVVAEWETGNISSSHRSINRMARALMERRVIAGYLIVPSRALYEYLTDRIGNYRELQPYFELWKHLPIGDGALTVIEVEHDATNPNISAIPKGRDGNAVRAALPIE